MIRPLPFAILLFAAVLHYAAAQDPTVRTLLGSVRGTTMTSRSGRTIYSFLGMRYAEPPVGELRFKLPEEGVSPKYPVLVYIHHGGWFLFSGQSSLMNPRYLMDEDIVFVAFNYRLGALGFLSTGDSEVPGNNGLKDQLQALKWVHDNIASFGGDPNLVTIYGYSAGAASVQYHMASPRSAGLFHRAISSSGSALSSWAMTRDPMALARRQAKLLNCPNAENATSKQIVECLRDKDAEEIANSYFRLRLYTDGAFLYGADTSVKMISSVSRSPVYYYQFVYRGRFGHMPTEPGMDRPLGAVHHDDLIYVFYPKDLFPFLEDDFPEAVVSKRLVKMWANFARTGNPTPVSRNGSDGQMGVSWTSLTPSDLFYLEIGEEPVMKNSLNQERVAIWEEYIYQKPRGDAGN